MIERCASAPGKVVIAGEYAVLHGAPALSMAVSCRARCNISASDREESELTTVGFRDGSRPFSLTGGRPRWRDADWPKRDTALFEAVLAESGWPADGPLSVELDSGAFADPDSGKKYGFGSSAAVAVALAAAFLGTDAAAPTIREVAGRAHRRFQSGAGSGIDIATSVNGGVIRFQRDADSIGLGWPDGLAARLFWSGSPASTREKIRGIDESAPGDAASALANASIRACEAWQDGDAGMVLAALAGFVERLQSYDVSEGRGIFDAGHARLVDAARDFSGVVYKPCGAGGGDVGMAFAESPDALAAFAECAAGHGFSALDAALDPDGVRFEG